MSIVELEDVHRSFGRVHALRGLSLRVERGTIVGLLGPNGAGKTTAVNVLTTLVRPDAGTARVAGHDVVREPGRVRSVIGLTGQFAALDDGLTARENLVLFGRLLKLGRAGARERAAELLDRFGLAADADRRTGGFSGGMRRRLDLAVSMVARPAVLFLDEPTTGLDPTSRALLWDVVRALRADGVTILLTTQYLQEADELADRIAVIDHGRAIAEGTAGELKARVGGSVCHLVLPAETRDRAAEVLAAGHQVTPTDDGLTVPAAGSGTLTAVLRALDAAGIEPADIALRRPTLDDVFFALTGGGADAAPEPAAAGAAGDPA
ncbi:daunorubicin resistance protein DrrA family ABC transporter ATP-binding protein [Actinomadura flavalba]|uniref:daunorubicin resistance protein DrrA family ABC transporter ATP-binding protein n=1 Tax=Actinomadura flavalba TaxID=1120938 RepID=UPI00036FAF62|nr:daunorubicin resistance protein DrrA family ABC transporter ATP-binding protein [Actinomadura flavalba]